jgi:hypothetical protein
MATRSTAETSLKRLGGGRWQTRDERFTIEPQSGSWAIVDAEQVDDLGLPLVRGPYPSLAAAKLAIGQARDGGAPVSPIAAQSKRAGKASDDERDTSTINTTDATAANEAPAGATPTDGRRGGAPPPVAADGPQRSRSTRPSPQEPAWLADLPSARRRQARDLIRRLQAVDASDAEGIARRDIVGAVPAAAAFAVERAITAIGPEATPADVVKLLASGRDDEIGVRWHLVDGDGRPITLGGGRRSGR